jgi:hypothetical protein
MKWIIAKRLALLANLFVLFFDVIDEISMNFGGKGPQSSWTGSVVLWA